MEQNERTELYKSAWCHWGASTQLDILIEEMAELTQAILKDRRKGELYSYQFTEELADVLICLEQIEMQLKGNIIEPPHVHTGWDQVLQFKTGKLFRLKERLQKSMESNK